VMMETKMGVMFLLVRILRTLIHATIRQILKMARVSPSLEALGRVWLEKGNEVRALHLGLALSWCALVAML
ncbi:hypothetical protein ACQP3D_30295, partial [Escherichia coli]